MEELLKSHSSGNGRKLYCHATWELLSCFSVELHRQRFVSEIQVESALIPELLNWACHRTVSFSPLGPVALYFYFFNEASIGIPHVVCVCLTFWFKSSIGVMCFKMKTFDCGICLRSTFHSRGWTLPIPQFIT